MYRYICIGIGGFLGANLRYLIKNWTVLNIRNSFPLDTLIINSIGCFLLALFLGFAFEILEIDPDLRLGISTGFIGAFTTFSTLCRETVVLYSSGESLMSAIYMFLSIAAGMLAIFLGCSISKRLMDLKPETEDKTDIPE